MLSIAVLVYFEYFHKHFMGTLEIERQSSRNNKNQEINEQLEYEKKTLLLYIKNITKIICTICHAHFNKLQIILVGMLIMEKVCLITHGQSVVV